MAAFAVKGFQAVLGATLFATGAGCLTFGFKVKELEDSVRKLTEASLKEKDQYQLDRNTLRRTIAYLEDQNKQLKAEQEEVNEKTSKVAWEFVKGGVLVGAGALGVHIMR
jgi:hypothetical protein